MKSSQKLLSIISHQTNFFFVCIYKMADISAKTWSNVGVSAINTHENDNTNKTLLKLVCISDIAKKWGGKTIDDLIDKEIK